MSIRIEKLHKVRITLLTLSTLLFPVTFYYLSPVLPMQAGAAGIISGSLVIFIGLFLVSMFVGRSFCSWVCPGGGIQRQVSDARPRLVPPRKIGWIKYIVWGVWLGMILFFFRRAGGISGIEFAFSTEHGLSTTSVPALISYSMVVIIFFLLSLIIGRRAGCHTLCWMAPFMILGRKLGLLLRLPSLRLVTSPESCVSCGRCTETCPMSLNVEELVRRGEITDHNCILCGKCISTCNKDSIRFGWRGGGPLHKGRGLTGPTGAESVLSSAGEEK